MEPSGSVEPTEEKLTVNGALPWVPEALATATGSWLTARTATLSEATSVAPLSSMIVSVTV